MVDFFRLIFRTLALVLCAAHTRAREWARELNEGK